MAITVLNFEYSEGRVASTPLRNQIATAANLTNEDNRTLGAMEAYVAQEYTRNGQCAA